MFGVSADFNALAAFREEMAQRGYEIESTGRKEMGAGLDRYSGHGMVMSIESDGAFWMIDIELTGSSQRDSLDVWSICLGEPFEARDLSLRRQLKYLRAHLAAIESACGSYRRATTGECLDNARRATQLAGFVTAKSRDIPER